jgi:hypothetical protein
MKEPTFRIEAQSFFDAVLKVQEGVLAGYRIEAEDVNCYPQQFGHYYFMTMLLDETASEPVVETAVETTSKTTRGRKAKTEESVVAESKEESAVAETVVEPVVEAASEPAVESTEEPKAE